MKKVSNRNTIFIVVVVINECGYIEIYILLISDPNLIRKYMDILLNFFVVEISYRPFMFAFVRSFSIF